MPGNQGYNPISAMDNSTISIDAAARAEGGGTSTHSSQQLMSSDSESISGPGREIIINPSQSSQSLRSLTKQQWFTIIVLCFVNLINYMDRFTVAGVLTAIQDTYNIGDDKGGLLQTAFILSYMICAPLFGYLGDRYSRRIIMVLGVFLWSGTTLIGSYMQDFTWFLIFRALVGVGEASYSTIAPTIISDLFVHNLRSKMLAIFYFAIPVGSGLGYIIGSETANLTGSWRWGLRITPFLGILAVILIFLIKEPERGQSEGSHSIETTSYKEDLKDLVKNKTFMLSTCGFTCVAFVAGALSWWGPKFIYRGLLMQPGNQNITQNSVSFTFGALTMMAGIFGVTLGSYLSQKFKKRIPTIDSVLCACGLLISVILLALSMFIVSKNDIAAYILCFFGQLALNINWAIVADILLYVVIPTRRSTAEAFQILISHMFGDAGSPYLIGLISEKIKEHIGFSETEMSIPVTVTDHNITDVVYNQKEFQSLQYALFVTCFVELLGAVFFFIATAFILKDKLKASEIIRENENKIINDDSTISVFSIDFIFYASTLIAYDNNKDKFQTISDQYHHNGQLQ